LERGAGRRPRQHVGRPRERSLPRVDASGVATTDGLTTTINIADGSDWGSIINDTTALVDAFSHGIADSGAITALLNTIEDLFNPAYF
jgi:hypothetical protein